MYHVRYTILFLLLGMGIGLNCTDAIAQPNALNAFLQNNTNKVYSILVLIHKHPMTRHGRYIILEANSNNGYVQCMFHDQDTQIYCEASSEFYQREYASHLTSLQLRAIEAQGFNINSTHGNYYLDSIHIRNNGTLWYVAGMMLETLYRGYGEHGDFEIKAPFVAEQEVRLDYMYHIRRNFSSIQK